MRLLAIAAASVLLASVQAQQKQPPSKSGWKCGSQVDELPYFYVEAALEHIEPPDWKRATIRISVDTGTKLGLWTDGIAFKLWKTTTVILFRDVEKSLLELNLACRLPTEPEDASALIKVDWESANLTLDKFEQIHQDFTNALGKYGLSAQNRYRVLIAPRIGIVHLDEGYIPVIYDNTHEHIEADVWNDPEDGKSMLDWIHKLEKLAEDSFHHSF